MAKRKVFNTKPRFLFGIIENEVGEQGEVDADFRVEFPHLTDKDIRKGMKVWGGGGGFLDEYATLARGWTKLFYELKEHLMPTPSWSNDYQTKPPNPLNVSFSRIINEKTAQNFYDNIAGADYAQPGEGLGYAIHPYNYADDDIKDDISDWFYSAIHKPENAEFERLIGGADAGINGEARNLAFDILETARKAQGIRTRGESVEQDKWG